MGVATRERDGGEDNVEGVRRDGPHVGASHGGLKLTHEQFLVDREQGQPLGRQEGQGGVNGVRGALDRGQVEKGLEGGDGQVGVVGGRDVGEFYGRQGAPDHADRPDGFQRLAGFEDGDAFRTCPVSERLKHHVGCSVREMEGYLKETFDTRQRGACDPGPGHVRLSNDEAFSDADRDGGVPRVERVRQPHPRIVLVHPCYLT